MSNIASNMIIFGVLLTIIGFIGTFFDALLASALPATLPFVSSIKTFIFEPMLVIGLLLLVIGFILSFRKP